MYPPLFVTLNADAPTRAIFGTSPLRVYPFGAGPAKDEAGYEVPYAVFQSVFGSPENYLSQVPDADTWRVQVDVYASTADSARSGAEAIRDALEPVAYVISYNGEFRETDTQLYRYSLDFEFITTR